MCLLTLQNLLRVHLKCVHFSACTLHFNKTLIFLTVPKLRKSNHKLKKKAKTKLFQMTWLPDTKVMRPRVACLRPATLWQRPPWEKTLSLQEGGQALGTGECF